ncbi:hypothetical protein [Nitrosomonas supralitoralis]|uniref:Lipoprotein n=1 Tax=Nitrosomonas supralitoralis TaxID=2116706 RepID=A0A2P7NXZ6_9PROT|nr:hypothetical protein [Nitrosomonas supralitoralis]PSJ18317.1 hypothetical protein C7H79_03805 [Nitrosomonas supralitoralis]
MIRFSLLTVAFAVLTLTACEGKKSLDGYPMDKPPPSAYAPRDSEPTFDAADTQAAEKEKAGKDQE